QFDNNVKLCGYEFSQRDLRPDSNVSITLYWQLVGKSEAASSFAHLLGSAFNPATNGPIWGQQDKQTPGGLLVEEWQPDKLYRDTYTFTVPSNLPTGTYQIEVGWYRPGGERFQPHIGVDSTYTTLTSYTSVAL